MTAFRVPVVVGLGRGVGTSTVAAALHAHEGTDRDTAADVVVCHDLEQAAAVTTARTGAQPLLAVTGDGPSRLPSAGSRFAAVVLLPHVERWAGLGHPPDELAGLLGQPVDHLPRPLQAYVAALRQLADTLVRSGQLTSPAPPSMLRPRAVELWRGLLPVERTAPLRPVLLAAPLLLSAPLVTAPRPIPVVPAPIPGLLPASDPAPDRAPDPDIGRSPDDLHDLHDLHDLDDLDDDALEAACAVAGRAG